MKLLFILILLYNSSALAEMSGYEKNGFYYCQNNHCVPANRSHRPGQFPGNQVNQTVSYQTLSESDNYSVEVNCHSSISLEFPTTIITSSLHCDKSSRVNRVVFKN